MKLRSDDLTWREIDGDLVVLDLRTSTYLTTNASGTLIMKQLAEERTDGELIQALVDAFGITKEQAGTDVASFLAALDSSGLLER